MNFQTTTKLLRHGIALALVAGTLISCGKSKDAPAGGKEGDSTAKTDTTTAAKGAGDSSSVGVTDPAAAATLKEALATSKTFKGFHASGTMTAGGQVSKLEADLGQGSISVNVDRPEVTPPHYIVVGMDAFATTAGGTRWGSETTNAGGRISQMITLPVQMMSEATDQGPVSVVGKETVDGVETTHLVVAAASPINIWVATEGALGTYVKRIRSVIEATDATIDNDVIFSKINESFDIKRP